MAGMVPGSYKYDPNDLMPNEVYKNQTDYAKALLYGAGQQPVKHWTQGVSNMVAALMGGQGLYNAGQGLKSNDLTSAREGVRGLMNTNVQPGAAPTVEGMASPTNPTEAAEEAAVPNTPTQEAPASEGGTVSASPQQVAEVLSPAAAAKAAPKGGAGTPAIPGPGGQVYVDPSFIPPQPRVSPYTMERMLADKRVDPTVRNTIMQRFLQNGGPIRVPMQTPYGEATVLIDPRNPRNQRLEAPWVRDDFTGYGGIKFKENPKRALPDGKGGWKVESVGGSEGPAPGVGAAPNAPPPDITLKQAAPGPEGAVAQQEAGQPFVNPRQPAPNAPQVAHPPAPNGPLTNPPPPAPTPPPPAPTPKLLPNVPVQPKPAPVPIPTVPINQTAPVVDPDTARKLEWSKNEGVDFEARKELAKKEAETLTGTTAKIQEAAGTARDEMSNLELMKKIVNDPRFPAGSFSGPRTEFDRLLNTLGLSKGEVASLGDSFEKLRSGTVMKDMRSNLQGLGQVRLAEIALLNQAMASKSNTRAANNVIIDLAQASAKQLDMISRVAEGYDQGYRVGPNGKWITNAQGQPVKYGNAKTNTELRTNINNWLRANPLIPADKMDEYKAALASDEVAAPGEKPKSKSWLPTVPPPKPPNKQELIDEIKRLQGQ